MIEGRIKNLDLDNRSATIIVESGKEYPVKFPERINIEITEDETVGLMGGELEDLDEGYTVEVELSARPKKGGIYTCKSVVCTS